MKYQFYLKFEKKYKMENIKYLIFNIIMYYIYN